jgi:hypothetical protein
MSTIYKSTKFQDISHKIWGDFRHRKCADSVCSDKIRYSATGWRNICGQTTYLHKLTCMVAIVPRNTGTFAKNIILAEGWGGSWHLPPGGRTTTCTSPATKRSPATTPHPLLLQAKISIFTIVFSLLSSRIFPLGAFLHILQN